MKHKITPKIEEKARIELVQIDQHLAPMFDLLARHDFEDKINDGMGSLSKESCVESAVETNPTVQDGGFGE